MSGEDTQRLIQGRSREEEDKRRRDEEERLWEQDRREEQEEMLATTEGPDGGWGWLVVAACFFATFTLDGIGYSFGMFMKPLKEFIEEGSFGVASIGSIQVAVYLFSGPLVARLVTRFKARAVAISGSLLAAIGLLGASLSNTLPQILVCYSIIGGIGFGLLYIPAVVASQAHFTRRRALAVGIAVCGTGVGTLVLPPIVEFMEEKWGWRAALQGLATLCLISVLCGISMFPASLPPTHSQETDKEDVQVEEVVTPPVHCGGWRWCLSFLVGTSLASSPTLPLFLMVMTGDFLATMSIYIPYTHLPDMAITRGVHPKSAALLISAAGIFSTIGRILAGVLCDQTRLHPMTTTLIATSTASFSAFMLMTCHHFWQFLLFASGFGLCTGVWVACETPLIIRTLSFHVLTPAFGLLTMGGGVAALTGAPLAGYVQDVSKRGHEGLTMGICGLIMGCSALAYLVASFVRKRNQARQEYEAI